MTVAPKKPLPKKTFRISAEHMSKVKCEAALAASGLNGVYPRIAADPTFTAYYHIKIRATKVQANRLRKAVWDQNHGASCEITMVRK